MVTQNNRIRRYLHALGAPAAGILLMAALQAAGLAHSLRYDRQAILDGEVWRLLSGNLVHLGWSHLWLNAFGLLLVWLLFGPLLPSSVWLLQAAWASLAVGLGLLWFDPGLHWYVGLSGTLHGLFVVGVLEESRTDKGFAVLVFAVFVAKLAWEQAYGPMPGSEHTAGGPVVVNAHLYGTFGGLLGYAIRTAVGRFISRVRSTR